MRRIAVALAVAAASAQDWPGWRGPDRDGVVKGIAAPGAWPEKLAQGWRIPVGEGHSSPVSAGGRLFLFTRQGEDEVLQAIDPQAGKILWRGSYHAPYSVNPAAARHGKGPKSTPLVHGARVYTLGISGILTCWDAATGRRVWQREFSRLYASTSPLYGAAMSPCGSMACSSPRTRRMRSPRCSAPAW